MTTVRSSVRRSCYGRQMSAAARQKRRRTVTPRSTDRRSRHFLPLPPRRLSFFLFAAARTCGLWRYRGAVFFFLSAISCPALRDVMSEFAALLLCAPATQRYVAKRRDLCCSTGLAASRRAACVVFDTATCALIGARRSRSSQPACVFLEEAASLALPRCSSAAGSLYALDCPKLIGCSVGRLYGLVRGVVRT